MNLGKTSTEYGTRHLVRKAWVEATGAQRGDACSEGIVQRTAVLALKPRGG